MHYASVRLATYQTVGLAQGHCITQSLSSYIIGPGFSFLRLSVEFVTQIFNFLTIEKPLLHV